MSTMMKAVLDGLMSVTLYAIWRLLGARQPSGPPRSVSWPTPVTRRSWVRSSQNNTCRDGLRPWQVGRVEARAKQALRSADPLQGANNVQRERYDPVVVAVRQLAFRLRPDELIGIEFRRVAREAVGLHPGMVAEKSLDVPTPMDFPAVPQQDNLSSEMTEQLAEKRDDLGARD